jgi:hypothetical protein
MDVMGGPGKLWADGSDQWNDLTTNYNFFAKIEDKGHYDPTSLNSPNTLFVHGGITMEWLAKFLPDVPA